MQDLQQPINQKVQIKGNSWVNNAMGFRRLKVRLNKMFANSTPLNYNVDFRFHT